ncbi:MAG: LysM domain-containing protein [Candidatus Limnocylindrales bacterium]
MPEEPTPNEGLRAAAPWAVAAVVVLAVAITAGFMTAYLVASGRSVDAPAAALASPTPRRSVPITIAPSVGPSSSAEATQQPRRTPTPPPIVSPEPSPFEHTIARGENLTYIAGLYCTTVAAIIEQNGIENANRIQVGQVILIPGGGCPEPTPRR